MAQIVDLPFLKMVNFDSFLYVYQRVLETWTPGVFLGNIIYIRLYHPGNTLRLSFHDLHHALVVGLGLLG